MTTKKLIVALALLLSATSVTLAQSRDGYRPNSNSDYGGGDYNFSAPTGNGQGQGIHSQR